MDGVRTRVIAVDFDGCLCENAWPDIGEAKQDVIDALLSRQKTGAKIILWTCRVGERLDAAVSWCAERGIVFDTINENLPVNIAAFGNDSRKVYADEYWDDKARNPEICNVSIPSRNKAPGPMLHICRDDETARRESEERMEPIRSARPTIHTSGASIPLDAEHEHDEAQATRKNRTHYLGMGVWKCGDDLWPIGEYCTISSIAELQEYERQEKANRREAIRFQRERLRGYVPSMRDLIETHHKCKACPFHIQKVEMWKRPFQSALSIYRSWKWDRGFRKRTIDGLAELEKKNAEQAPE